MIPIPIKGKMQEFLQALPPHLQSLVLFDQASHIIGFAIFDSNDRMGQARIFNVDGKEIFVVSRHTHLKVVVNRLLREQCVYTV